MDIDKILIELNSCEDLEKLETVYKQCLGKEGTITVAFKWLKGLNPETKKQEWQKLADARTAINDRYNKIKKVFEIINNAKISNSYNLI